MSFSIVFVACITSFHSYTWATRLVADSELGSETTKDPDAAIDPYTSLTCDFNTSFCGWENLNLDFQWELGIDKDSYRKKGRTGVKKGKYIYINSDRGRNRTAFLGSGEFNQIETACMKFRYHMKGRHIGHLKIYDVLLAPFEQVPGAVMYQPIAQHLRWIIIGQQSPFWLDGQVQMPALDGSHLRQVIIEAFDWEEGRAGNIVLDDIRYLKDTGTCTLVPSWADPPPTPTTQPQTTMMTTKVTATVNPTSEETTKQITFTEIPKRPRLITPPVRKVDTTPTKIDDTTTQFPIAESTTVTNTSANIQTSMATRTFATQETHTEEKTGKTTAGVPYELSTLQTSADAMQTVQVRYMYTTTRGERSSSVKPVKGLDHATVKTGGGIASGGGPPKLQIGLIVSAAFIGLVVIVIVIVCCCRRIQRTRKFEYYDNHTVHMARIAGEDEKQPDDDTEYEKLTS